jgi:hypothetical protein
MFFLALSASLVRLRRFNDRESFRASMAKERKRLLNEDLIADVPVTHDDDDDSIDGGGHRRDVEGGAVGGEDVDDDDEIKVKEDQRSKKKKRRIGAGIVKSLRRGNRSKDKDVGDDDAVDHDKHADVKEESVGDDGDQDKISKITEEGRDNKGAKS